MNIGALLARWRAEDRNYADPAADMVIAAKHRCADELEALAAQPAPGVGGDWYSRVPKESRFTASLDGGIIQDEDGPWVIRGEVDKALLSTRPAESVAPVVRSGLIDRARAEYRDSDAAGDVLDWMEEQLGAESVAQGGEAVELDALLPNAPLAHDERADAEQAYTLTAFDYTGAPIGSRDWTIYWRGWWHRAVIHQAHPAPAGGGSGESA